MDNISDNHWRVLLYKQRCTKKEAQNILLNHETIIFRGSVYKIKCEHIGAGIYEISKEIEAYKKG